MSHTACDISLLFWALGAQLQWEMPLTQVFVEPEKFTQEVACREGGGLRRRLAHFSAVITGHYRHSLTHTVWPITADTDWISSLLFFYFYSPLPWPQKLPPAFE